MARLNYDELDREYRNALRRIAQLEHQRAAYRAALLTLKGRLFGNTQAIDATLEALEREHGRNTLGHDLNAIASRDVRHP